jgi:LacI family transcriptional regulator
MFQCPYCQQTANQLKTGRNLSGSQRYLCKSCQRKYTPAPNSSGYPGYLRKQAILMCFDGQTFRAIARKLGVNHQTVANWVNDYVVKSARAVHKHPRNLIFD